MSIEFNGRQIMKEGNHVGTLDNHVILLDPKYAKRIPYSDAVCILAKMKELQSEVKK